MTAFATPTPTDHIESSAVAGDARQLALLAGLAADGRPMGLGEHRRRYPAPPRPGTSAWTELINLVEHAGLLGRSGAGFPTARKMRSVAGQAATGGGGQRHRR